MFSSIFEKFSFYHLSLHDWISLLQESQKEQAEAKANMDKKQKHKDAILGNTKVILRSITDFF